MPQNSVETTDRDVLGPLSLLIVEDDPDTRSNLTDILEMDGYRVQAAESFGQARREARWDEYFAIVLDRKLPDGNSEVFLPELRQLAPQAAIVVVTGYEDLTGAIAALRNGASDYLIKPVDADTLRSRLRQLAEKRQAELALKVGVQQSDLCRMETGEYKVSLEALFRILKIFEMNVGEFFHGS